MKTILFISSSIVLFLIVFSFAYLSKNEINYTPASHNTEITETAPEIKAERWINSDKDLTLESLRGKVVLIEFWTYGCYNCRNTIPYINKWYETYKSQGLEIIGIHCP